MASPRPQHRRSWRSFTKHPISGAMRVTLGVEYVIVDGVAVVAVLNLKHPARTHRRTPPSASLVDASGDGVQARRHASTRCIAAVRVLQVAVITDLTGDDIVRVVEQLFSSQRCLFPRHRNRLFASFGLDDAPQRGLTIGDAGQRRRTRPRVADVTGGRHEFEPLRLQLSRAGKVPVGAVSSVIGQNRCHRCRR